MDEPCETLMLDLMGMGGAAKPQLMESLCEGGTLDLPGESVQGHQAVFCSALS